MTAKHLIDAYGGIEDAWLEDAIKYPKKRRFLAAAVRRAAILILLIFASFAFTFHGSAAFREWFISFTGIKKDESIPQNSEKTNNTGIQMYASGEIGEKFTVRYLESDNYFESMGEIFYYTRDTGEHGFCLAAGEQFTDLPAQRIRKDVELSGIKGRIDYSICSYKGRDYLVEESQKPIPLKPDGEALFTLSSEWQGELTLFLHKNAHLDLWSYPAEYTIEGGKIRDYLKNIEWKQRPLSDYAILRNWQRINQDMLCVEIGNTLESAQSCLINTRDGTAVDLAELVKRKNITGSKCVEGHLLIMEKRGERFNYYCYRPRDNSCTLIYENAAYWDADSSKDGLFVSFTGGRYDFIRSEGEIYLADELTGKRLPIEGMTESLAESALISTDNSMLAVSGFQDNFYQLGIIDIEEKSFYLWKREQPEDADEYSLSWSKNSLVVQAEAKKTEKHFAYIYSKK